MTLLGKNEPFYVNEGGLWERNGNAAFRIAVFESDITSEHARRTAQRLTDADDLSVDRDRWQTCAGDLVRQRDELLALLRRLDGFNVFDETRSEPHADFGAAKADARGLLTRYSFSKPGALTSGSAETAQHVDGREMASPAPSGADHGFSPVALRRFESIPSDKGLYWYFAKGQVDPEPMLADPERYPGRLKAFNGREQGWLREGEYLLGPQVWSSNDPVYERALKLTDIGRRMVEITTTVRYEQEWDAIPELWLRCANERDELRTKLEQLTVQQSQEEGGLERLHDLIHEGNAPHWPNLPRVDMASRWYVRVCDAIESEYATHKERGRRAAPGEDEGPSP